MRSVGAVATEHTAAWTETEGVGDRDAAGQAELAAVDRDRARSRRGIVAEDEGAVVDRRAAGVGVGAGEDVGTGDVDDLRRPGDRDGGAARSAILGEVVGRGGGGRGVEIDETNTGAGVHLGGIQNPRRRGGIAVLRPDVQGARTGRGSKSDHARSAVDDDRAGVGDDKRPNASVANEDMAIIGPGAPGAGDRGRAVTAAVVADDAVAARDQSTVGDRKRAAAVLAHMDEEIVGPFAAGAVDRNRSQAGATVPKIRIVARDGAAVGDRELAVAFIAHVEIAGISPVAPGASDRNRAGTAADVADHTAAATGEDRAAVSDGERAAGGIADRQTVRIRPGAARASNRHGAIGKDADIAAGVGDRAGVRDGERAGPVGAHLQAARHGPSSADGDRADAAGAEPDSAAVAGNRAIGDVEHAVVTAARADVDVGRRMVDRTAINLERAVVDHGASGVGVGAGERFRAGAGLQERASSGDDPGERITARVVDRQLRAARDARDAAAHAEGFEAGDHLVKVHIEVRAGVE